MDTPTAAQRLSHFSQRPPPPPPLPLCQLAPPSARLGPDKTAMDLPAAAAPSLAPPSRRASRRPPRRRTATEEGTGDDAPWLRVTCKMTRGGGPFFLPFFFFFLVLNKTSDLARSHSGLYVSYHSCAYLLLRLRRRRMSIFVSGWGSWSQTSARKAKAAPIGYRGRLEPVLIPQISLLFPLIKVLPQRYSPKECLSFVVAIRLALACSWC
jgi:hypothetical protein